MCRPVGAFRSGISRNVFKRGNNDAGVNGLNTKGCSSVAIRDAGVLLKHHWVSLFFPAVNVSVELVVITFPANLEQVLLGAIEIGIGFWVFYFMPKRESKNREAQGFERLGGRPDWAYRISGVAVFILGMHRIARSIWPSMH